MPSKHNVQQAGFAIDQFAGEELPHLMAQGTVAEDGTKNSVLDLSKEALDLRGPLKPWPVQG
ncbi:MAG: hypothetical protein HOP36_16450 [Methyloglobulus sp.]|nr:hypothetical protein [Methyloglobulus sp.]